MSCTPRIALRSCIVIPKGELARGRPLSRSDDKQEWNLLMKTSDRLLADCPEDRKSAISDHFKTRLRRVRDAALQSE